MDSEDWETYILSLNEVETIAVACDVMADESVDTELRANIARNRELLMASVLENFTPDATH